MGPDLGDDLTAIPGGELTAPGMGAIDLIQAAGGGVVHLGLLR